MPWQKPHHLPTAKANFECCYWELRLGVVPQLSNRSPWSSTTKGDLLPCCMADTNTKILWLLTYLYVLFKQHYSCKYKFRLQLLIDYYFLLTYIYLYIFLISHCISWNIIYEDFPLGSKLHFPLPHQRHIHWPWHRTHG